MNGAAQTAPQGSPTTSTSAPSSAPAPASKPASSPSAAPPRDRAPDGKFQPGRRGEARKRILAGDMPAVGKHEPATPEAPVVELGKGAQPPVVEAKPEAPPPEPKAPEIDAGKPETWPEKVREAHEALQAEVDTHKQTIGQWEDIGRRAVEQNRRLAEEVKLLRAALEQSGGTIDPRDLQLMDYRVRDESVQRMAESQRRRDEYAQHQAQEREQATIKAEAQKAVAQMVAVAKAKGVDVRALYAAQKTAAALGEQITYEDAAQRVLDQLEWRQKQKNAAAPTTTVSSIPAGTTMPKSRTRQGRLDRLRALGHNIQ